MTQHNALNALMTLLLPVFLAACGGSEDSTNDAPRPITDPGVTALIEADSTATAGQPIGFDGGGSSGNDLVYRWQFGDGRAGGGNRIAHIYTDPGTYEVSLTVVDADGDRDTATRSVTVEPGPQPVATDATLAGVVTDVTGAPLAGVAAEIVGASPAATTDAAGQVSLTGVASGVDLVVRLTRDGYAEQLVRTRIPAGTSSGRFEATLIQRRQAGTLDAGAGGRISGVDGTAISVPAGGLVDPAGDPVSGDVEVALTPIDIGDDAALGAFPGSFAAVRQDASPTQLLTLGVAEFFLGQGGEALQLAPGSSAELTIPLYADQVEGGAVSAGDSFPFWSLDEATGQWIEEGSGTVVASSASPTGLAFRITVSHLSWWNCDLPTDPASVQPTFRLAGGGSFDPGESVFISGRRLGTGLPRWRIRTNLPAPNDGPDAVRLPLPPDSDLRLSAGARNGTLVGQETVNAGAGETIEIEFVLAPPPEPGQQITLPHDAPATIDPAGEVDRYRFSGTAGQGVQIGVADTGGSSLAGTVTLRAPDGSAVTDSGFDLGSARTDDELFAILPENGEYTIEIDATANEPGGYQLVVRTVPRLTSDTVRSATVAADGEDLFLLDVPTAAVVTGLIDSADPTFDTEAWTLARQDGFVLFEGEDRNNLRDGWVELDPGTYVVRVPNNDPVAVDYDIVFPTVQAPLDPAAAARNRATAAGDITVPGDIVLYRIPSGAVDDGVFAALEQAGSSPLPAGSLRVAVIPEGQSYAVAFSGISGGNIFAADPDPGDGVLANRAGRLGSQTPSAGDTYVVVLKAGFGTGGYRLRIDRAPGGTALTADRDGNCGGNTRSVRAAIHAAGPGDTVTVCGGRYEEVIGIQVPVDNLTLSAAAGSGAAVIATRASSEQARLLSTVGEGTTGLVLEGITLAPGPEDQQGLFGDLQRIDGGGFTTTPTASAPALSVTRSGAVIENATFSGMDEAISVEAPDVIIRSNTFTGGQVRVADAFGGADTTLENNVFDAQGVDGRVIELDDGAVIEGNTISAAVADPANDADVPIIEVRDTGNGSGAVRIAGNTLETDGGGLWIRLSGANVPQVDIEANELHLTNAGGAEGLDLDGPNLTGGATSGRVRIRNNVIDGIVDAEIGSFGGVFGIDIDNADALSSLAIVNNSIRAVDAGATAGDAAIVFDDLADDAFSGALGVDFVNNLVIGPGGNGNAVGLPSGTTFDADFNHLSGFAGTYAGGSTTTGTNDQTGPAALVASCTDADENTLCRLEVQSDARAVDAGARQTQYVAVPGIDIDGDPRPAGNGVDIGAHEQ